MVSILTRRQEELLGRMIRLAGSERNFEEALSRAHRRARKTPTAQELLDEVILVRLESLRARRART